MTPEILFRLAPLAIALPIAGLLLNLAFGRRLGERFAGVVACAAVGLAFVVSVVQVWALTGSPQGATLPIASWIEIGRLRVDWALQIDSLAVTMMLVVTGVGLLIHIYATAYMHDDVRFNEDPRRYTRFFVFFNLFIASMLILVTGDSFLTLFVGWEGVGLCSYLLIGFWYEKGKDGIGNAWAGKKAFITNRVGDAGFLIGIFLIFTTFGTLNFNAVFAQAEQAGAALTGIATAITLCLLIGAAGKSAQIPLYVWLPDAMAGPTPVSALIHAATMVTAGIYMIVRSHALFALAPATSQAVAFIGGGDGPVCGHDRRCPVRHQARAGLLDHQPARLHGSGRRAGRLRRGDVPSGGARLLQGAALPRRRLRHPGDRARAPCFPSDASHGAEHGPPFDPQDMRNMGGIGRRMRITYIVYLVGALSLAGLPPLVGFFSKDEILVDAFLVNKPVYLLLASAALLTAFYTGRQIMMVFYGPAALGGRRKRQGEPAVDHRAVADPGGADRVRRFAQSARRTAVGAADDRMVGAHHRASSPG